MASNRKSDSFSPPLVVAVVVVVMVVVAAAATVTIAVLLVSVFAVGSAKRAFSSCTGLTGAGCDFCSRGLVDLSTLGRPVDPLEGIIRLRDESGSSGTHLVLPIDRL